MYDNEDNIKLCLGQSTEIADLSFIYTHLVVVSLMYFELAYIFHFNHVLFPSKRFFPFIQYYELCFH